MGSDRSSSRLRHFARKLGHPPVRFGAEAAGRQSRIGCAAAPVRGVHPDGRDITVPVETGSHLLLFLTTSCEPCQPLWTAPSAGAVLVTPSPSTESRRRVASLAPSGHLVVMSSEAWNSYGVTKAPWLVLVDDGTVVQEGPAEPHSGQ